MKQSNTFKKSSDYFDYAHCISAQLKNSTQKDNKLISEAEALLSKAKKKDRDDDDIKLQSDLINACLYKSADQNALKSRHKIFYFPAAALISDYFLLNKFPPFTKTKVIAAAFN